MRLLIALCLVLFFVAFVAAEKRHGHPGSGHGHHGSHHHEQGNYHHEGGHHKQQCSYTSTQGFEYDLRMLETALRERDWKIYNSESKTTFHLNPCGSVHAPGCPEGSAVCEVDEKQQGISFGSAEAPVWADGANGNTFEITFGNGELCNNGIPRKSVVSFSCALPSHTGPFRTHVTQIDEEKCTVNILVESPHACPVQVFCNSIKEPEICGRTQELCFWRAGHCIPSEMSWLHSWAARHHVSPVVFLVFVGMGSFLMSCSLALCCCACCRAMRRRANARAVLPTKKSSKKSKKTKKVAAPETPEQVAVVADAEAFPMEEFPAQGVYVYQPLQAQLQDIYAQPPNGYGFHMVQLVPGQHLQMAPQ